MVVTITSSALVASTSGISLARMVAGEPVADRADVVIDAENFLDDDHGALRRAGRIGAIGAELELVCGSQRELLTQGVSPDED